MRGFVIAAVIAGGLVGASRADAKVRVVTSIETLAALTRAVGGELVEVQALGKGYSDPHFVEPKLSLVSVLNRADLLAYVGLDLEVGWLPGLVTQSRNPRIQPGQPGTLDCSTAIPVQDVPTQKVDRSMGDIHPRGNPHYWIPPDNAVRIAQEIARRLTLIDAGHGAAYNANLKQLRAQVAARLPGWNDLAAKVRGQKVVTYHKSWTYLSSWVGLQEVGYVEPKPGVPPSPQHLANLIALMKREGVRLVLVEMFYSRRTADLVANKAGARLLSMPSDVGAFPYITDYFKLVDAVLQTLTK
ncbi:MAG: zinc ABC transporter substrate-binding protein [Deltaproteobacteria bacterium]|nr:zinc ABC transporter substrate-binding protein [Deltaproteobacteria bacterium]